MNSKIENCGKLSERIQLEKINENVINRIAKKSGLFLSGNVTQAIHRSMSKPSKIRVREKSSKNRVPGKVWSELVYMSKRYGYDDLE